MADENKTEVNQEVAQVEEKKVETSETETPAQ